MIGLKIFYGKDISFYFDLEFEYTTGLVFLGPDPVSLKCRIKFNTRIRIKKIFLTLLVNQYLYTFDALSIYSKCWWL